MCGEYLEENRERAAIRQRLRDGVMMVDMSRGKEKQHVPPLTVIVWRIKGRGREKEKTEWQEITSSPVMMWLGNRSTRHFR